MAELLVPDEQWAIIEPPLPPHPPRGERRPADDRVCFAGILFVLKTGMAWEDLPQEMNCGSGMTCWQRLVPLKSRRLRAAAPRTPGQAAGRGSAR